MCSLWSKHFRRLIKYLYIYSTQFCSRNAAKHAATAITQRSQPMPKTPSSPSHYKQPPTPEHPPPNAELAEQCIHDRMRQLGQVGGRTKQNGVMVDDVLTKSMPHDYALKPYFAYLVFACLLYFSFMLLCKYVPMLH